MKTFGLASLAILALAACSSTPAELGTSSGATGGTGSGTSGGGASTGTTTGPLTATFTTVDIHPAAKAALQQAGFPIPSITNGDYLIALDGVSVDTTHGIQIVLTDAGVATLTSTTGPYVFAMTDEFRDLDAVLGVIGVVKPFVSQEDDAGSLPQPTCPQFAKIETDVNSYRDAGAVATIPDYLLDAGFKDYIISTGLELGATASPPLVSISGAVAYAVPMSYAVMLNCAGNPAKTTRDTDIGEALVYITDGAGEGQGSPVAGAVAALHNAAPPPPVATYYASDYSATDTTGTDSTGVATYLSVSPASTTAPTITINGAAGFTHSYAISTQPDAFFSIVAYPH